MSAGLTPSTRVVTAVAFPEYTSNDGIPALRSSPTDRITIESCAEFLDQHVPGSRFGSKADCRVLHDLSGQPMILSAGSDQRLYLCVCVNGGWGGWVATDITPNPSSFKPTVYEATKTADGQQVVIVVSGHGSDKDKGQTEVWQVVFACPDLSASPGGIVDPAPLVPTALPWIQTTGSLAGRVVRSLACTPATGSRYRVVAAVDATAQLEGSYFVFDSESAQQGWKALRLAQQVHSVLSCAHGNVPKLGEGEFVLFQDASADKGTACLFQSVGAAKAIFLTGLRRPQALSTSVNERGLTDLWIATEDGIGYVNHMKLGEAPERLLPGIAFSKVFAVESRTRGEASKLLVYALSSHGELYIVEGRRPAMDKRNVRFEAAAVPIRTQIRTLAGNINSNTGASEIVYISQENDSIHHLIRDPTSCLWKQSELVVRAKEKLKNVKVAAYVVNISLTNGNGAPVPVGFQVQLTSDASLVYVNERTYHLDQRPQLFSANQFGRIVIVVPAADGLGAAPIGLRFPNAPDEKRVFYIQPAQRVLNSLGHLTTGASLKTATTSDGRSLFPPSAKTEPVEKFDEVAQVLARVPAMVTAIDPSAPPAPAPVAVGADTTIVWQTAETSSDGHRSWLDDAMDVTGSVIGDVVEFLKSAVKGIVKVAMKIVGPVITFILKIGAKVIRFALNTISTLVTGLASLLEGVFGIDLSCITDFFKFRYKRVTETQKEITFALETAITLSSRYLHHHRETLTTALDAIGEFFETLVGSQAIVPDAEGKKDGGGGGGFFDNPIISNLLKFNPLSWIMEAISEELGDDFKIPALNLNFVGKIFAELKKQFELLWAFFQRSWTAVKAAFNKPAKAMEHLRAMLRDGFWTIFNAIKSIIISIYDLFLSSYDSITTFCKGEWKIPFVTDLWKELADCDFTLVNFVAYFAAQVLEMANPTKTSLGSRWNLGQVFGGVDKYEMPPLLPALPSRSGLAGELSFQDQLNMTQQAQVVGKLEMATNPVREPRFGPLMASPAAGNTTKKDMTTLQSKRPSQGVKTTVALLRAGKVIFRSLNLVVQGSCSGALPPDQLNPDIDVIQGDGRGASSFLSEEGADGLGDLLHRPDNVDSDASHDGLNSTLDFFEEGGGKVSPHYILIGANALACICQITEQVFLYNHYDEALRKEENYGGNQVELLTGVVGLLLSFWANNPAIMAMSNLVNTGGGLAAKIMHPAKDGFIYAGIGASGSQAVSSLLFLAKEPTCQGIAWVGTGLGVIGNVAEVVGHLRGCVADETEEDKTDRKRKLELPS